MIRVSGKGLSLTWRLVLWFIVIALLPLASFGYLSLRQNEATLRGEFLNRMSRSADRKTLSIRNYLAERVQDTELLARGSMTEAALSELSRAYTRHGAHSAEYRSAAKPFDKNFAVYIGGFDDTLFYDIFLITPQGEIIYTNKQEQDFATNLINGPYRDSQLAKIFRESRMTLESSISRFETYAPSSDAAAFVSVPIIRAGALLGIIAFQLDTHQIYQVVNDNTGLGVSGETTLAQRTGADEAVFVAPLRRDPQAAMQRKINLKTDMPPIREALSGQPGSGVALDYDGKQVVAAWRYLPELSLGVVVKIDTDEVYAPLYRQRRDLLGMLLALAVIGGLIAFYFGRRMVVTLKTFARTADEIAQGDLHKRVDENRTDEIGVLGSAFNHMTEKLEMSYSTLEDRVEERTNELNVSNEQLQEEIIERELIESNLRTAEERLVLAQEFGEIGVWDLDLIHDTSWRSLRHDQIFGYESLQPGWGQKIAMRHVVPEDREAFNRSFEEAARTGKFFIECRVIWPDESIHWIMAQGRVVYRENTQPVRMLGTVIDITERKRVELQLLERELQYRTLADSGQALIWTSGTDKLCNYFNKVWLEFTGRSMEQELGNGWAEGVHPDDFQHCLDVYVSAFDRREKFSMDYRLRRHDGEYRWIQDDGCPRYDSKGEFIGYIGYCLDITERKQAANALIRSEQHFRAFFERSMVGMAETSPEKGWVEVNDRLCEMLGYSREELAHMTWAELTHQDDLAPDVAQFNRVLAGDIDEYTLDKRFIHRDGHVVYTYLALRCIRREDGAVDYFVALVEDITERKLAETALRESESQFSLFMRHIPACVYIKDMQGRHTFVNEMLASQAAPTMGTLLGKTNSDLWPREISAKLDAVDAAVVAGELPLVTEEDIVLEGETRNFLSTKFPIIKENGEKFIAGVSFDITERKLAETALRESEERLHATIETSMDAIVQMDADGNITGWNSMMEKIFGWTRAEAIGRVLHETIIPPQHREAHVNGLKHFLLTGEGHMLNKRVELVGMRRDGHIFPVELTVTPIKMGGKYEFSAFLRDITQKKESEAIIWRQANFDVLTGLPNRHMFHDRMEQEIKKAKRAGRPVALMFIDLDHFKEINDTLGHDMGDLLLIEAARRINECVRATDIVARLGGDEFTVLVAEFDDVSSVERIATSLTQKLAAPFHLKEEMGYVSASVGITLYPNDAETIEGLFKSADQAMYAAKNLGRNRHSYFTNTMQEAAQIRLKLVNNLRDAVAGKQFLVYFQPIVELATGNLHKAEALVRWQHPERGMVMPVEFIPLAEETGLIFEIGDWVFHESMRCAKRWRALYNPVLQISVNKSPVQFYKDGDEHTAWLSHLKELDLHGQCLAVEITEGLLLDSNKSITGALLTLHNADVQVSIDDFGTGYSSLSYLKKFDIDYLKIDRSFIHDLATDPNDLALSKAIIVMAHELGIKVIAEGVETKEQHDLLAAAGCDYAQGYLYSMPVPPEEFEELLKQSVCRTRLSAI